MGKKDIPTDSLDTLRCFLNGREIAAAPFFTAFSTDFPYPCYTLCVQYGSRNNYSVVYGRGSRNSVNPQMSLCPARVRFRDSANVSPSSAGIPKRKCLFPKKETNAPVTKMKFSWGTER